MSPKPPEIRAGFLSAVRPGNTCESFLATQGVKGDLQMHTLWSDGTASIEEMAQAAVARGYEYIAITDHAKGLKIAGGIDESQLETQAEEIAQVNAAMASTAKPFRVLRSIELNLSPSGAGDMDSAALSRLDFVLGCFHSALRKKEDQTERYLAACAILICKSWAIHEAAFIISSRADGRLAANIRLGSGIRQSS